MITNLLRRFASMGPVRLPNKSPKPRARLGVEYLEDRQTPTVVFQPQFGPEHATDQGGLKLNDVPIYLIYKGSYWANPPTPGNPSASDITAAAQSILGSAYYHGLTQYGIDGKAHIANTVIDGSDPVANFSDGDLTDVVVSAQDNGDVPDADDLPNDPLYIVITAPGVQSGDAGAAGYNILQHHYDFPFDYDRVPLIWVGGITPNGLPSDATMLDKYTTILSHEIAEAMTCIGGDGIITNATDAFKNTFGASQTGDQIGDNEADRHTYRINGASGQLVQSYWSQQNLAYLVPDGNAQTFSVSNGVLTINDDQRFGAPNDTITVGTSSRGGPLVTLNLETVQFDPGQVSKIVINSHTGNDKINIDAAPVPVDVFLGNGNDTVTVGGAAQSIGGIVSNLTIHGGAGTGALTINDQGNHFAQIYRLSSAAITISGAGGAINYDHLTQVTVNGAAAANNTVFVDSTSTPTTFNAGARVNSIQVSSTGHNLDNIGTLTLNGGSSGASLVVHDENNGVNVPKTVFFLNQASYTVTSTGLTRDAVSGILIIGGPALQHRVANINYSHLNAFTLDTGVASNTDAIQGTPAATTLNAGAADAITAGNPGLGALNNLTVDAHGGTLTLNDQGTRDFSTSFSSETHNVTYTVAETTLTRLDHIHSVTTNPFPLNPPFGTGSTTTVKDFNVTTNFTYSNVASLVLQGPAVTSTFNIQGTAAGSAVTINSGKDGSPFVVGRNGSVGSIRSALTLNGAGAASTILLDDSRSLTQDNVTVTPTQVGAAAIDKFFAAGGLLNYGNVGSLTLNLSNAADDTVLATPSANTAYSINGNASQFQAGHGAILSVDLAGVTNPEELPGSSGTGLWRFGNRQGITFSGIGRTAPA